MTKNWKKSTEIAFPEVKIQMKGTSKLVRRSYQDVYDGKWGKFQSQVVELIEQTIANSPILKINRVIQRKVKKLLSHKEQ